MLNRKHRHFQKTRKTPRALPTARHIRVPTEEKCNELKSAIEGGADFAQVAKDNSTCPSNRQGGDLGSFGPGQMVKEFDTVVFSAPLNIVQGPVKTQICYHLLDVTSRQDCSTPYRPPCGAVATPPRQQRIKATTQLIGHTPVPTRTRPKRLWSR